MSRNILDILLSTSSDSAGVMELISKKHYPLAGTGHRPNKLGGYEDDAFITLVDTAKECLLVLEPSEVISGMALGWDQALAVAAVELGIPFIAAVPFRGQEKKWHKAEDRPNAYSFSQEFYHKLIGLAKDVVVVCEGEYAPWKMQRRNEYMNDKSLLLLSLWDGTSGGTKNCLDDAAKKNRLTVNAFDIWKLLKSGIISPSQI